MIAVRQRLAFLALALALLLGGCVGIVAPPSHAVLTEAERAAHNRRTFDRAWNLVNDRFFDAGFRGVDWAAMKARYRPEAEKAANDEALYATLNRMLEELKESHNYAMTPQQRYEMHTKQRALVGLRFMRIEKSWVVSEVMSDSPAAEAGVQPGWLAVTRDGQPLGSQVFASLKEGQAVAYEFLDRDDHPHAMTMVARNVSTAHRSEERDLPDGFVYLRFDEFNWDSMRWLSEQLKQHRNAPGVVIDLRSNPGGWFYSLEFVLGEFFPKSMPLGTVIRRSGTTSAQSSWQLFSARYAGKVAVLTDGGTASCAEILTDALRYYHRAIVVGRKTAGAVVVSYFYSLPDGGELQLAIQDFRGLDGQRLEGLGVKPDIDVPLKLSDLRAGIDADLAAALENLRRPEGVAHN